MIRLVLRALLSQRGAAMVEYALLAALIAVAVAVSASSLGIGIRTKFTSIAGSV